MNTITLTLAVAAISVLMLAGCSDSSSPEITTGTLAGIITDEVSDLPLPGVRITLFNANTNAPVGGSFTSGSDGSYRIELPEGTYFLKLAKQGYEDVPPKDISPFPVSVSRNQTTTYSIGLFPGSLSGTGSLAGRVTNGGAGYPGVTVVASAGGTGFSATTDGNGDFAIYNVPPATYTISGWISGFVSSDTTVNVVTGTSTPGVGLRLTAGTMGAVTGSVTFLSTTNIEVDVSLTNPDTRETIPGLSTRTVNRTYFIGNVPPGTYVARATYANDGKVVDPDWILKNGEPYVTVATDTSSLDFSVTGSIELVGPTNVASSTQPVEVADTLPTLTWDAYPSADNYIIEVINAAGRVIWGGIGGGGTIRNVLLPKTQTSVVYNFNGTATEELIRGKVYRWKIYVSKDDSGEPNGWKLISASEDQRGLIRIAR